MILLYINMNIQVAHTHSTYKSYIRLIIHTHTLHTYTHGTYKTQNKLLIVQAVVNEFNDSFSRFLTLMIALDRPRKPSCSPAIHPVNCVFYWIQVSWVVLKWTKNTAAMFCLVDWLVSTDPSQLLHRAQSIGLFSLIAVLWVLMNCAWRSRGNEHPLWRWVRGLGHVVETLALSAWWFVGYEHWFFFCTLSGRVRELRSTDVFFCRTKRSFDCTWSRSWQVWSRAFSKCLMSGSGCGGVGRRSNRSWTEAETRESNRPGPLRRWKSSPFERV